LSAGVRTDLLEELTAPPEPLLGEWEEEEGEEYKEEDKKRKGRTPA